jgi:hypothetical protein
MKKNEVFNPDYFDSSSDDNSHKHGCLPECKDMREWNSTIQKMIDAKVKSEKERKKVKCGISDILYAHKRLIRIDVNDVTELFQEGGEVHIFDASVDASNENRMSLIISVWYLMITRLTWPRGWLRKRESSAVYHPAPM